MIILIDVKKGDIYNSNFTHEETSTHRSFEHLLIINTQKGLLQSEKGFHKINSNVIFHCTEI